MNKIILLITLLHLSGCASMNSYNPCIEKVCLGGRDTITVSRHDMDKYTCPAQDQMLYCEGFASQYTCFCIEKQPFYGGF